MCMNKKRKRKYPTQSNDKIPYNDGKLKKVKWQHQNVTSMFGYTAIADRLRTISRSNYNHTTGLVKWFTGPTFPLLATAVKSEGHTFEIYLVHFVHAAEHENI